MSDDDDKTTITVTRVESIKAAMDKFEGKGQKGNVVPFPVKKETTENK